jgi:hypothetical protein
MTAQTTHDGDTDNLTPDEPVTTKEGWRRFVDHQPTPPITPPAEEFAALPARAPAELAQARRDYHSDLPLAHTPTMKTLLTTRRLLIQLNRGQISARRGMILSGASGTGKSTALTQLGRIHERSVRKRHPGQAGNQRIPVVYVTVPTDATPKILAVQFARFYGIEFGSRATMPDIVNTVCAVAARTHLELVLLDEIHNILGTRARAEVSDQPKYFAERLPATFTYSGIEVDERGLFAGPRGRQIAGRFTLINSAPFDYGHPRTEDRLALAHRHTRELAAPAPASTRHPDRAGRLPLRAHRWCDRQPLQLIRGAAILAIGGETEQITPELLELIPLDHAATSSRTTRRRKPTKPGGR